jgi:excisionase family DNA binding protein
MKSVSKMAMLSLDEAAQELRMSKRALRRLISSGELPAYRVGRGLVRIKSADLDGVLKPVVPNGKN